MDIVHHEVCGLDVHQATIVACALIHQKGRKTPKKEIKTFSAMHADLIALRDWMKERGITSVVMEGTGIYWRPVYEVLEDAFDLWVVNARHVKKAPGRKTDVIDAEWLARLLLHGLLRKSFVPPKEIRALRDLTRYRRMLVQTQTMQKNRILKLIEQMGIKLASVASDVFGRSGMAMLYAIAEGSMTSAEIAQLARAGLRNKVPQLVLALDCMVADHHREMLKDQLESLAQISEKISKYEAMIAAKAEPYAKSVAVLQTIPGVKAIGAYEIFAEVGPNLAAFENSASFSAWVGTAPGVNESAGKNRSGRRRKGNAYLTSILVECGFAATRKKDSYLREKFRRLRTRRPPLVALFAIANKLAHAVYRVLTTGEPYKDLGAGYFDRRDPMKLAKNLMKRIGSLDIDRETLIAMLPTNPAMPMAPPAQEDRGLGTPFS